MPGASTGIDTQIVYKHPGDPNAKPPAVRQEVFTFPVGTRFDDSAVPDCTASEVELRLQPDTACPKETWIGSGHGNTSMTGFPGAGETPIVVNAFEYGGGAFRVVGGPEQYPVRSVVTGRREGRVTTVNVPASHGGPPDGETALRRVRNIFPARSSGRRAYVRTPRRCPSSGVWTFKARLTFADGGVERNVHRMPCRRKPRRTTGSPR
ncbi:MAG TPA: hypothetical protein VF715_06895 [Thermoleophilaceae bacterium]